MSEGSWVNQRRECRNSKTPHGSALRQVVEFRMPCVTSEFCRCRGSGRVGRDLCEQNAAFYVHPPSQFMKQSRIYVLPGPLGMQICLCVFMQTIRGSDIFLRFVYISTSVSWILCWRAVAYEYFFSDHSFTMKRFFIVSTIEARRNIFCACWLNQKQLFVALRFSIFHLNGFWMYRLY